MPLQNIGPANFMLWKQSMDGKKTGYQQNYSLNNEIHAKNSRSLPNGIAKK
jgi:hypothetical protein